MATRFGVGGFEGRVVPWAAIIIVGFLPSLRERRGKKTTTVSESLGEDKPESGSVDSVPASPRTRALFHPPWPKEKTSIRPMHFV